MESLIRLLGYGSDGLWALDNHATLRVGPPPRSQPPHEEELPARARGRRRSLNPTPSVTRPAIILVNISLHMARTIAAICNPARR